MTKTSTTNTAQAVRPSSASSARRGADTLTGHTFRDASLLRRALTHRSYSYELNGGTQPLTTSSDNEQMEFLGDAVLGLVVAQDLVRRFPGSREGELTRMRASLVSRKHLAEMGERLRLGDYLLIGRGEVHTGGRRKPALLANAVEAIIAALFLDGGLAPAEAFIVRDLITPALPALQQALATGGTFSGATGDYKSALQELLQGRGLGAPQYQLVEESGPDHRRVFHVELHLASHAALSAPLASSEGSSKKEAQQRAAQLALDHLRAHPELLPPPRDSNEPASGGPH